MSKYLTKTFSDRKELKGLGFKRRWSCSRNWSSPGKMELFGTKYAAWDSVRWTKHHGELEQFNSRPDHPLVERVGDDLAVALGKGRIRNAKAQIWKELLREF